MLRFTKSLKEPAGVLLMRSPRSRHPQCCWPCPMNVGCQRHSITTKSNNPFHVLGVSPSSSFRTVQKAFVKLAMEHHPDTAASGKKQDAAINFVRIRQAFERIRDGGRSYQNGDDCSDEHGSETPSWTEDDFLKWFNDQTGLRLTSQQRRELVHLYRSRVPGGRYDGPSWDLARRLVAYQDAFLKKSQQRGRSSTSHGFNANNKTRPPKKSNLRRKRRR